MTITSHHWIVGENELTDKEYCLTAPGICFIYKGHKYQLGFSPEGRAGRKDFGAEPTTELFGWLNAEPVIIADPPMPTDIRPQVKIEDGDIISVAGHGNFEVSATGYRGVHPQLTAIVQSDAPEYSNAE